MGSSPIIRKSDERMKAGEVPVKLTIPKKIAFVTGGNIHNQE